MLQELTKTIATRAPRWGLIIGGFGIVASFALAGTAGKGLIDGGPEPDLLLMSTGDVIGYIDSCGCKLNPAGGLARRGWTLKQLESRYARAPIAIFDTGNFTDLPTAAGNTKTKALIAGMAQLGYSAVNVGERDVNVGYPELIARFEAHPSLHLISANIVRQDTQVPVFPAHVVVEAVSPNGKKARRVGVIGAIRYNPLFQKRGPDSTNLVIAAPAERIAASVAALRAERVDLVVLLAAMNKDDVKKIIEDVPGLDYVFGAYGGIITQTPERIGSTTLVYLGTQGQRLSETRVFFEESGKVKRDDSKIHWLTASYPADPVMLDFVNAVPVGGVETQRPAIPGLGQAKPASKSGGAKKQTKPPR